MNEVIDIQLVSDMKNESNGIKYSLQIPLCEFIGSLFLVIAAIAPMILFVEVLKTSIALAVLADAIAVGFILFALIEIFGPICTSFFNPAVCLSMVLAKDITWKLAGIYIIFQILGGISGVVLAHLMFYDAMTSALTVSTITRSGGTYIGEVLGTFILVLCILSLVHQRSNRISLVVGFLVGGMLLSTSSTMFANPQVTIARIFTGSAAGIRPIDAGIFIVLQLIGSVLAFLVWSQAIMKHCLRCDV